MKQIHAIQALLFLIVCSSFAQFPSAMNYQGRLVDGTNLVTGSHTIEFLLCTNSTGSGQIFYAESDTIEVNDGFYATEIGDNPLPPGSLGNGEPLTDNFSALLAEGADKIGQFWMEVRIDGTPLSPREKLLATPYAMASQVALEAWDVADGSIRSWDIAFGTITSANIANGTITRHDLADGMRSTLDSADGSLTDAVVVDDDGNVGIGTATPLAGVQIDTGVALSGSLMRSVLQDGGTFNALSGASCSLVQGDLVYVAGRYENALSIINISDLDNPFQLAVLRDGVNGFDHLGGVYWLAVDGNYLYAASPGENAVSIINISIPVLANLTTVLVDETGGYSDLDGAGRIAIHNGLLFIPAVYDDAVTIVDIATPTAPVLKSVLKDGVDGFNELDGAYAVACESNYLYIASSIDDSMTIADISDPANPVFVAAIKDGIGTFQQLDEAFDVAVSGGYAYVAARSDDALTVVDCRTPSTPQLLNTITNGANGFTYLNGIANVGTDGSRLYIAAEGSSAVTVADLSDPAAPRPVVEMVNGSGGYSALLEACHVFPVGDRLYLAAKSPGSVTIADLLPGSTAAEVGLYVADRVGIGTPLPTEALDVRGSIVAQSDIKAGGSISSVGGMYAQGDIVSGNNIAAEGNIESSAFYTSGYHIFGNGSISMLLDVNAGNDVIAGRHIKSTGNMQAQGYIWSADDIIAGGDISSSAFFTSEGDIRCLGNLITPFGIIAEQDIEARRHVKAAENIEAQGNILSEGDVIAGGSVISSNNVVAEAVTAQSDLVIGMYAGGANARNVRMDSSGRLYPKTTRTGVLSIHPSAFLPVGPYYTFVRIDGDVPRYAPVQLPHNATVTSLTSYFKDFYFNEPYPEFHSVDLYLQRQPLGATTPVEDMAICESYYTTVGGSATDTSISYATIDNNNYSYYLFIDPSVGEWSDAYVFGVKIVYTTED